MYYDSNSKNNYIKRFNIETSTIGKEFYFLEELASTRLLLVTTSLNAKFKFNYHSASGQKKTKEIEVESFVDVKGWKSIGNKVTAYKRMSGYEVIENRLDNKVTKLEDRPDEDNPDAGTLNLFE
tara:strand:- start:139 stop:510 length:372 start_codon:yes stop_codon:yes gene_type:complete